MQHRFLFPALFLSLALGARADELTKSVQAALKEQGFFYGEVTGASGPETAAAVKRYQIRNGLEVTGTLTKETLEALGVAGEAPPPSSIPLEPPTRPAAPVAPAPTPRPPIDLRKDNTAEERDREFLRREPQQPPAQASRPQTVPAGPFGRVFAQTPYASAPVQVQQDTIKRAQRFLRDLDFFRDDIDGVPGPALEEGLLSYQRFIALPLTGVLDMETLAAMRLLPGRGGAPAQSANPKVRTVPGKTLRGVWIR